jgi:ComF family protein
MAAPYAPGRLLHALGALFFPHLCPGCGDALHDPAEAVCPACLWRFPETGFARMPDNPVERLFWGRVPLAAATSRYYFTGASALQAVLHALKYQGDRGAGHLLGRLLGRSLREAGRFVTPDAILPMPLHPARERLRGYNQAEVLARGVSETTGIPVAASLLQRRSHTASQTRKNRSERWRNVSDAFHVGMPDAVAGRKLLLVDDVVTTGASLEACAAALLAAGCAEVSVATVAYAGR